ncbi:MAG TPA: hypothetical protein VKB34_06775 [Povalibacter sp.]|nr:hypothetical protein [Povalibacter sp.]
MDIWNILGIEPTPDERAIKRAYAARLKVTSPEDHPAEYMQLRDAYEGAKQQALMRRFAAAQAAQAASAETQTAPPESPSSAPATPELPPQYQVLDRMFLLLKTGDRDGFLRALGQELAGDMFATLDDRHELIGNVAVMLLHLDPPDPELSARVAELVEAREHENLFEGDHRFRHAYAVLLHNYGRFRAAQTTAHSSIEVAPGYLHVYHVLTSPFDAERLGALMRSQTYHRLAERILERARTDDTIVIPAANREWWDRTTMRGQPQPEAAPRPAPQPTYTPDRPRVPFFLIFVVIMGLARMIAAINSEDTPSPRAVEEILREQRAQDALPDLGSATRCDPLTQRQLDSYLEHKRGRPASPGNPGPQQQQFDQANESIDLTTGSGSTPQPPFTSRPEDFDPVLELFRKRCRGTAP